MGIARVFNKLKLTVLALLILCYPLVAIHPAEATFPGQNGRLYIYRMFTREYTNSENENVTVYPSEIVSVDIDSPTNETPVLPINHQGDEISFPDNIFASSADGNRLVFTKASINLLTHPEDIIERALWVADADGSNAREVLKIEPSFAVLSVSWSPDNHTVALALYENNTNESDVYTVDVDSSSPALRPLLTGSSTNAVYAQISPDGDTLAYTDQDTTNGNSTFYTLDISGGFSEQTESGTPLPRVTPGSRSTGFSWEPSGTLLANEVVDEPTQITRTYRFDVTGSSPPVYLVDSFGALTSPDGSILLYAKVIQETLTIEIYRADTNGNNPALVRSFNGLEAIVGPVDWQAIPDEAQLESISVSPAVASIARGAQQQLTTTAHFSDDSTQDVTSQATYESSNPAVATVNATGNVTGVGVGQVTITATYEGQEVTSTITVNPVAPGAPTNVAIANGPSAGQLRLTWQAPADNGGAAISNYLIFRRTGTTGAFTQIASVNGSTLDHTDTGLTTGTTYYYYVVAVNSAGQSAPSATVSRQAPGIFGNPICVLFICI